MKAVVKTGEYDGVKCIEIEKPLLKNNEVLIEIHSAAICGTDMDYYEWGEVTKSFTKKKEIKFPFVLGHECSGVIVKVGEGVKTRKLGDRVAIEPHIPCQKCYMCLSNNKHNCLYMDIFGIDVNGGFAEYVAINEDAIYVIPDDISFEQGALLEPAGVAMNAIDQADVHSADIVLVNGCGPIGLLLVLLLKNKGVENIVAIDGNQYKLDKAKELGAITINYRKRDVHNEVKSVSEAHSGVDVVFEASGSPKAYPFVFEIVRKEGKIITIGHPRGNIEVSVMNHINTKGIMIKGIFGRRIWDSWEHLVQLIKEKNINLAEIVSGTYLLDECEDAFENVKTHWGKTMFKMERTDDAE